MRKLFAFLTLSGLVIAVAATAQAQRFGGGGFQQQTWQFLTNKSVQEELKLTEEQKTKIKEVADKITEAQKANFGKGFGGLTKDSTKEEREKAMAKLAEAAKETNEKAMKELKPLLKDEQYTRLVQIERQQMRLNIFTNEEFVKTVGITDEQKEKIKAIVDESNKDQGEIRTSIFKQEIDQKDGNKKIEAIRKDASDKVMELLKAEQKTKYKELLGENFEGYKVEFGGGNFGKNKNKKDKDK